MDNQCSNSSDSTNSERGNEATEDHLTPRQEFLLRMYNQLWNSMQRVEGGMWSFVTAYAAIAVSVILGVRGEIDLFYAAVFTILVSFWGMNIAIAAGRWRRHNLNQISNIEREFLDPDSNDIIPEEYFKPSDDETANPHSVNKINFWAFFVALLVVAVTYFSSTAMNHSANDAILIVILAIGGVVTVHNKISTLRHLEYFKQKTQIKEETQEYEKRSRCLYSVIGLLLTLVITITFPLAIRTATNNKTVAGIFTNNVRIALPGVIIGITYLIYLYTQSPEGQ